MTQNKYNKSGLAQDSSWWRLGYLASDRRREMGKMGDMIRHLNVFAGALILCCFSVVCSATDDPAGLSILQANSTKGVCVLLDHYKRIIGGSVGGQWKRAVDIAQFVQTGDTIKVYSTTELLRQLRVKTITKCERCQS
jgi:hypothetical protein